nr:reverse transcriptase domain-containing protein [Tanacetum cinerariifolium]
MPGNEEGMFQGYKVNTKGLKVCLDKVNAVLSLPSPKMFKGYAKIKRKLASLDRALRGPKLNYTSMEKLVLALVHASKRLKRYFQAHPIIVITDQPIQQILSRPEVEGRLQKWSIELGEYAIHYRPRVSVKGQILADFIVERTEEDSPDTQMEEEGELSEPWILFTDGSSYTHGFEARLILTNPEGMEFTYALRFRFDATNIETQYEALIARLRIAEQMGVKNLQANVDSRLVANQVNRTYVAKEADMIRYLKKALIPTEIGMPTLRTTKVDLVGNNEALEINLDLLKERREEAAIREAKRKLGPKWEGPYDVTKALGKGTYKLRDRGGKQLSRTWNISNLKKCHIHKM